MTVCGFVGSAEEAMPRAAGEGAPPSPALGSGFQETNATRAQVLRGWLGGFMGPPGNRALFPGL